MRLILTLSTFLSLTFAHSPSESSNSTVTNSASPSLQTITVGKGGTSKFDPESLAVPPGSKVVFEFYPGHNSVVQGSFDKPCSPSSNLAFYSGYVDSDSGPASLVFTVAVDNADPIWFYSGSGSHCEEGMVGVINPSLNQTLAMYKSGAASASKTTLPSTNNVQGGVLAQRPSGTTSASTSSATAKGEATTGNVSIWGITSGFFASLLVAFA